MIAWRLWGAAVAVLGAVAARSAEITDLPQLHGAGIERGVASLRCSTSTTGVFHFSRGAVIETGAGARADVLLTTAHGLPVSAADAVRNCRVIADGREYAVHDMWRTAGDSPRPEDDWAVVLSERIRGDLVRWRVAALDDEVREKLLNESARVRLVLRYANNEAQTSCHLESRAGTPRGLLPHSCITYPGMSGSPMVLGVEHEPVVIGVHVGSGLEWNGWKIELVSVARPIDAPVIEAIAAATERAAQSAKRRR
jgi:hypothetical protein